MYHIEGVVTVECCGGHLGRGLVLCDDYFENGCKRGAERVGGFFVVQLEWKIL